MAAPKWLSNIGHFIKVAFTNPKAVAVEASVADILLPGFIPLINSAATAIINSETTAAAAGIQSGTGAQKMAYAIALFTSTYNTWAAQNGLSQEPAAVQALLQNVFNLLNEIETVAPVAPATPVIPTTPTATPVA